MKTNILQTTNHKHCDEKYIMSYSSNKWLRSREMNINSYALHFPTFAIDDLTLKEAISSKADVSAVERY